MLFFYSLYAGEAGRGVCGGPPRKYKFSFTSLQSTKQFVFPLATAVPEESQILYRTPDLTLLLFLSLFLLLYLLFALYSPLQVIFVTVAKKRNPLRHSTYVLTVLFTQCASNAKIANPRERRYNL